MNQELLRSVCEDAIKQANDLLGTVVAITDKVEPIRDATDMMKTVLSLTQLIRAADQCAIMADKNSQESMAIIARLQICEGLLRQVHAVLGALPFESTLDAAKRVMGVHVEARPTENERVVSE